MIRNQINYTLTIEEGLKLPHGHPKSWNGKKTDNAMVKNKKKTNRQIIVRTTQYKNPDS